jgi:bacillithiol biosynthesis cysteine-adding enzyme BshC
MMISKSLLDLNTLPGFSSLLKSYIGGDQALKPLYAYSPDLAGLSKLIDTTPFSSVNRKLLSDTVIRQYKSGGIIPDKEVADNMTKLASDETYTVCTGHQLCLFTGPLYFIYKLISTINLAERLKREYPDKHFVPVYWMATEDHDFEEINHAQVFGKKLVWDKTQAQGSEEGSMPAGSIATASLQSVLKELEVILGNTDHARKIFGLISAAYLGQGNLANATRHLVNALLGTYGLVILDPDDAVLKVVFSPFLEKELENASNFELVNENIRILQSLGYDSQVNPREINLFYIAEGKRSRIEKTKDKDEYKVLGTEFCYTHAELMHIVKHHPERFSPNVVLRPLYQQVVLPNLAYVGGPGELAYWLEYKKMFDKHGIQFPVLMPRNFVTWIDPASAGKMKKLDLHLSDLSGNIQQLEKMFVDKQLNDSSRLDAETEQIRQVYTGIVGKAEATDTTLRALAESELQKVLNGLKNIESRISKAEKQKHETSLNQLRNLKEKLFPGGNFQERVDNFLPLYVRYGSLFIDTLKKELDPLERQMVVFTEE